MQIKSKFTIQQNQEMFFKDLEKEPKVKKHFMGVGFEGNPDIAINLICHAL
jgi:hypothetical protein